MLAGSALVAVPIVIYLINRQRHQRRRWAAMEFLIRAMRRNRRRVQLQNLFLLLVRCAIVLLMVLAAARPVSRLGILGLKPDEDQSWILAMDLSYSMGYQEGSQSLFEQARETVLQMVDGLLRPGDQMALMTLEARPKIVLGPTRINDESKKAIRRELEALELGTGSVDLGASFAVLDELAGKFATPTGDPQPKRIIVFSDLQRKDWLGDDGPRSAGLEQYVEKIQKEGGSFAFARLSALNERPNLVVTDLSVRPSLIARDVFVELRATVRNFGEEDFSNVELTLRVDQDPSDRSTEPQVGQVIRVARGQSVSRSLPYKFSNAGYHTVVAEVRSDNLVVDNRRFLALKVEERVRVLLVDGDPAANPSDRSTFHLKVALEPDDDSMDKMQGRFTPFETEYVTIDQLGGLEWKQYAIVILSGVPELASSDVTAVENYVRSGGALIVFLGPNVRPEFYNQHFRAREPFLLPGLLGSIRGDERYPVNLEAADLSHPIVQYFGERRDVTHLERPIISFEKYFQLGSIPPDQPGTRVAFRYTDLERSPAIVDNSCGSGRVLWVTSTADTTWNEFPRWPDYVIFLHEAISYLVKFGLESFNLPTGEPFRKTFPASQFSADIVLVAPEDGSGHLDRVRTLRKAMKGVAFSDDPALKPAETQFELVHEETDTPGLYQIELRRSGLQGGNSSEYFSANVDTRESDLRAMTDEDFHTAAASLKFERFDASTRIRDLKERSDMSRGKEHWAWLVAGVLGLLFLESILAWFFGRRVR